VHHEQRCCQMQLNVARCTQRKWRSGMILPPWFVPVQWLERFAILSTACNWSKDRFAPQNTKNASIDSTYNIYRDRIRCLVYTDFQVLVTRKALAISLKLRSGNYGLIVDLLEKTLCSGRITLWSHNIMDPRQKHSRIELSTMARLIESDPVCCHAPNLNQSFASWKEQVWNTILQVRNIPAIHANSSNCSRACAGQTRDWRRCSSLGQSRHLHFLNFLHA
jgi:hypothetical protein